MALTISQPFLSPYLIFSGQKSNGVCQAGQVTNIDMLISAETFPNGVYCNGARLMTENASFGDSFTIQVVDVNNVLGRGSGAVLSNYVDWYVDPNESMEAALFYGDIIPPLLYLRVAYTSVGSTNVNAYMNWCTHDLQPDSEPLP